MSIYLFIKRIADVLGSILLLLVLAPIIVILITLLIFANNGRPFFFQKRPGKNGEIFTIVKFKTMNDKTDKNGKLLPDNQRITKIGGFIRNYSLDELMQLINVLLGDMSFVGPRPLLIAYLPLYNNTQGRRHEVKPGITGWAQVNGRNAITWERKFELDVWYVDHISFATDLKILWKTVLKVILREGINSNSTQTMPMFTGSTKPDTNNKKDL
ncbi:sugar transferase [Muriicola soli]|uniref:Sugar transferase n=1 Tax=Muriicola soli TaxID=2507538 RepID=A0A411E875_9FLAO|nr:sugar transferase [Muriicola soli]QBA63882.1 sugar transferase [Muriicola soli]